MANQQHELGSRPDEDNPEWTADDFAKAQPASDVVPRLIGQQATDELLRDQSLPT